jgi:hypothetical protein
MDRVLIAIDQIQFSSHLEMTLRKVGFDVETITTEFNLSEKLLTFNPDMIIARGQSTKLSAFNIGKKIKENLKYTGQIILIFGSDQKIAPNDLEKIKSDMLLFEPIGALKLTVSILNLDPVRKELMLDRLLRMAETDSSFRSQEQSYLVSHGQDLDREIINVQGKVSAKNDDEILISDEILNNFTNPGIKSTNAPIIDFKNQQTVSKATQDQIREQLQFVTAELPLRIDNYNHQIKKLDGDLKTGLNKRHTKSELKKHRAELMVDPGQKKLDSLDQEKQKFAKALFQKK